MNKLRLGTFGLLLFFVISTQLVMAQDAYRMRKLSSYNNPNLPKVDGTDIWNDITGYFDPVKKREYIVCGGTDSVYFFDITDASNMVRVDAEDGASFFCRNRDYETYLHYAYCVSDQGSGIGALQIFDLQYLPDSVHKVYESNVLGSFTHTIFIDSSSKRMYMSSNSVPVPNTSPTVHRFYAMDIVSLENPEQPVLLSHLKVPTKTGGFPIFNLVHEMFARHDTAYLSCGDAGLFIFDLRDTATHTLIGTINSYPDQGYNHSSWLDKSGKNLMFTDENMGLDIKIFNISNLANPQLLSQFNSHASTTSHNAYWYGDFAYVSAYHDGVRVYNVKDPANPVPVAWYDTHPESPEIYGGYKGCWGVYPYLPSKHIIASDLTAGIFVFEIDSELVQVKEMALEKLDFQIYPNPAHNQITIASGSNKPDQMSVSDAKGNVLIEWKGDEIVSNIDLSQWAPGLYIITIYSNHRQLHQKILKW